MALCYAYMKANDDNYFMWIDDLNMLHCEIGKVKVVNVQDQLLLRSLSKLEDTGTGSSA